MKKVAIGFWDADAVLKFVSIVSNCDYELDLICGGHVVDAKSLLAVLSMNTVRDMELVIHSDRCEGLLNRLKGYTGYGELSKPQKAIC